MQYVMLLYVKNNFGDVPLFFHVPFFSHFMVTEKGNTENSDDFKQVKMIKIRGS